MISKVAVVIVPLIIINHMVVGMLTKELCYGVEIPDDVDEENLECFGQSGYDVVFIYLSTNILQNLDTIVHSIRVGLGVEAIIHPRTTRPPAAREQFTEVYENFIANNISVKTVWLEVLDLFLWNGQTRHNVDFILNFIQHAKEKNVKVGIYTSMDDWMKITSNSTALKNRSDLLWNWHAENEADDRESNAESNDADDFIPYGHWKKPTIQQFGVQQLVCGVYVTAHVFYCSKSLIQENNNGRFVVGGNVINQ